MLRLRYKIIFLFALLGSLATNTSFSSTSGEFRAKGPTALGDLISDNCEIRWGRTAAKSEPIRLQRLVTCVDKASGAKRQVLQVMYDNQLLFTTPEELGIGSEELAALDSMSPEEFSQTLGKSINEAEQREQAARTQELARLNKRLQNANLAIISFRPYDVSEHTDGTGLTIEIANLSKKTIKYVTFTYVGLNAVGDPVKDMKGPAVRRFRGIGPIEPRERATYERDYTWMTDIVERARIVRIEIEYMDRSKKILTKFDQIFISEDEVNLLGLERS